MYVNNLMWNGGQQNRQVTFMSSVPLYYIRPPTFCTDTQNMLGSSQDDKYNGRTCMASAANDKRLEFGSDVQNRLSWIIAPVIVLGSGLTSMPKPISCGDQTDHS